MKKTGQTIPTVTIGLAAHNEEKNIVSVLRSILSQKRDGWKMKEIIVACDGCTDKTAALAKTLTGVTVVDGKERKGKAYQVSRIIQKAKGELVVLFDADIGMKDANIITRLVHGFANDPSVAVVGGNPRPVHPETFFERAVYSTFLVFEQGRKTKNGGHNVFGCCGACMALRTSFGKMLSFDGVLTEDDYIYLSCLARGLQFRHIPSAVVYYKLPRLLADYLRQCFRSNPEAACLNFRDTFGSLVEAEYHRPLSSYARSVLTSLRTYPLETLYIIVVNLITKPFYPILAKQYRISWWTAKSTK